MFSSMNFKYTGEWRGGVVNSRNLSLMASTRNLSLIALSSMFIPGNLYIYIQSLSYCCIWMALNRNRSRSISCFLDIALIASIEQARKMASTACWVHNFPSGHTRLALPLQPDSLQVFSGEILMIRNPAGKWYGNHAFCDGVQLHENTSPTTQKLLLSLIWLLMSGKMHLQAHGSSQHDVHTGLKSLLIVEFIACHCDYHALLRRLWNLLISITWARLTMTKSFSLRPSGHSPYIEDASESLIYTWPWFKKPVGTNPHP